MATALKALLKDQHLHGHSDFARAYNATARRLNPKLVDAAPTKAQFYRWLSGELRGLPRGHHCRVLEEMFPGWTAEMLFADENTAGTAAAARPGSRLPLTDSDFETFLGAEMVTAGTTLVYPTFELTDNSLRALSDADIPRQHHFGKKNSAFSAKHRIDVPSALAENDVRGMLYVFSVLQRYTSILTEIQSDHEVVAQCDRPYISFGLSSNDCTHMYLQTASNPLFTIEDDPKKGTYLEYVELRDGTQYSSTDDTNMGLIARVRPNPNLHPDRYWIYCAGLGPRGTTGASWYLANYWSTLQKNAGTNEFVAVVKVHAYSDQTATLEHMMINSPDRNE
ncbi:hypothetical protein [Nocardia sp. alder85J]|uniref:hypothetical protein n=1 Tax=Nocardia sp. alder85J TaxID=2862949 RepID=UPI001CD492BA|nr:hypothetical protein [Nocardia sp. alder85J]MCX4094843.1 hypothetical protein [Nocardia sp. alder85J]